MSAVLVRRIRGGLWGVSSAVTERGLQGKAEWPSSVRGRPFGRVLRGIDRQGPVTEEMTPLCKIDVTLPGVQGCTALSRR
jgi:hypothetical protein